MDDSNHSSVLAIFRSSHGTTDLYPVFPGGRRHPDRHPVVPVGQATQRMACAAGGPAASCRSASVRPAGFSARSSSTHYLFAAISLCGAVAGFVAGTEYFLGHLRRRHLRPMALACGLGVIGLYGLWHGQPLRAEWMTAAMLGAAMLWSGLRLGLHRNRYRFLGMALIVRGMFNLANSLGWIPPDYESWFVYSIAIKTISMLCLIHAVQEKIQPPLCAHHRQSQQRLPDPGSQRPYPGGQRTLRHAAGPGARRRP